LSQQLKDSIKESKLTVEKVKRGSSLFDLDVIKTKTANNSSMIIKQEGIKEEFDHYLDLSYVDMAYVPGNIDEKIRKSTIDII